MNRPDAAGPGRCARALAGAALLLGFILGGCSSSATTDAPSPPAATPPNILFVIMDDVGLDQMAIFGQGGPDAPLTPTIDSLALAGLRFDSAWSMPACSTSRAAIFEGRFPLRTQVMGALGPFDLANSMVSPYATTVPRLLATRGYESALLGKFHIALQGNNRSGDAIARDLGWNYFAGWLDATGDPGSIDTTAGGVAPKGTYGCGFVPDRRIDPVAGADFGACYQGDGSCTDLTAGAVPAGRRCRDQHGLLDPGKACALTRPNTLNFGIENGHYVSPLVFNRSDGSVERVPLADPRARTFRATFAADAAIEWINARPAGKPWMATVSFASAHTPLMQPPVDPSSPSSAASSSIDCADQLQQRGLSNLMIESIDLELSRLLLATGLARRSPGGQIVYTPAASNTVLVIVGDNGSLGSTVKPPWDPSRAKGTAYQTGVSVPLIIAGPMVSEPGRTVSAMVNLVDLYALFGEIAGIGNVQAAVPATLDAVPMLGYLTHPQQPPLRAWNYTEVGTNLQVNRAINGPCVISNSCTQIPVTKGVCEDNSGVWWGQQTVAQVNGVAAPADGFQFCCQVNAFSAAQGGQTWDISPLTSVGIRNDRYKLVQNTYKDYVSPQQVCVDRTVNELYAITAAGPGPWIDRAGTELPLNALTPPQQVGYDALRAQLAALRASAPPCPGDGNGDGVVDARDVQGWRSFATGWGLSSVYDLNLDGLTNEADLELINTNLGRNCRATKS